jgi:hypothetical protein
VDLKGQILTTGRVRIAPFQPPSRGGNRLRSTGDGSYSGRLVPGRPGRPGHLGAPYPERCLHKLLKTKLPGARRGCHPRSRNSPLDHRLEDILKALSLQPELFFKQIQGHTSPRPAGSTPLTTTPAVRTRRTGRGRATGSPSPTITTPRAVGRPGPRL